MSESTATEQHAIEYAEELWHALNPVYLRRIDYGLTKHDLNRRSQVAQNSIRNIERGHLNVRIATLWAIARGLGTTPGRLMAETCSRYQSRPDGTLGSALDFTRQYGNSEKLPTR